MRRPCCHSFLAFILKFLNFLQAFVGVSIIVYSSYMLNQWQRQGQQFPPPPDESAGVFGRSDVAYGAVSSRAAAFGLDLHSLPDPWFIYAFMGIGVLVCCITFIGHIGAEAINGCCLCSYSILAAMFIILEVSLVAFIALDHNWEKDIPFDPTGELDTLRIFIENNIDLFLWVGIAIITIQVLSLFLALVLRSLISVGRDDDDDEEDYGVTSRAREPLLAPYAGQARGDSDIWSSRLRDKYGLNGADPSVDAKH